MLEQMVNYYSDGNKAKFAAKLGIKPQALSMWFTRNSFDAELIYTKCEHISAEWLLSQGKGEMLREENAVTSQEPITETERKFYQDQINFLNGRLKELEGELLNQLRVKKADVG